MVDQSHTPRTKAVRYSGLNSAGIRASPGRDRPRSDTVIRAGGQLDALRYESILQPRGLVGVRGVGYSYDGFYYVQQNPYAGAR